MVIETPALYNQRTAQPEQLWVRGETDLLHRPLIAVIGTRQATRLGTTIARAAVDALSDAGATLISGLAAGCDQAAARRALELDTPQIAVLGGGLDMFHNADQRALADDIIAGGGLLVSQHPDNTPISGQNLQRRNRIIIGSAQCVTICQADYDSRGTIGALGQALALDVPIIQPTPHNDWKRHPGAQMLFDLIDPYRFDPGRYRLSAKAAEAAARHERVAHGVATDRDDLRELYRLAITWSDVAHGPTHTTAQTAGV